MFGAFCNMTFTTSIRLTGPHKAMVVLGATRSNSVISVGDGALVVRMGWLFRAEVPLPAARSADPADETDGVVDQLLEPEPISQCSGQDQTSDRSLAVDLALETSRLRPTGGHYG